MVFAIERLWLMLRCERTNSLLLMRWCWGFLHSFRCCLSSLARAVQLELVAQLLLLVSARARSSARRTMSFSSFIPASSCCISVMVLLPALPALTTARRCRSHHQLTQPVPLQRVCYHCEFKHNWIGCDVFFKHTNDRGKQLVRLCALHEETTKCSRVELHKD